MRKSLYILMLMMVMVSCKKENTDLDSPIPSVELISITPETATEFQDSITITFAYRDGDGDLGENRPDIENLFVIDNRIGLEEGFRIPQLAPDNSTITIAGTLSVALPGTGITDNSSQQSVNYTLYIRDRAGNESNRVVTQDIIITQ